MKIKVSSKFDSFRRAGLVFVKTPQTLDVDQKIFDLLKAEPMLVVREIQEENNPTPPDPLFSKEGEPKAGELMPKKGKGK